MTTQLYSTTPGTSTDYIKYLFDFPKKTDQDGDSILLDFSLANTDSNFVQLYRGNYVVFNTGTYGTWYTGYITNEPEYVYLGEKGRVPHWGFNYEASSDDYILSMNALGIMPPFMNMTQGQIIKALANRIAPGLFDVSNVQDGLRLARYVVNPTQKFGDVVAAFAKSAVYRFWGKNLALNFIPYTSIPQGLTVDTHGVRYTPSDLTVKASVDQPIINDSVVMGNIEPQRYTTEYFVGDGYTGAFPLSASVFGVESVVLLSDNFSSSSISTTNWTDYDEPENYLTIYNGFLNCTGGLGDGSYSVHLDSANTISLGGAIRLAHGEFDFVPQTDYNNSTGVTGVICGLWTEAPNYSFVGCIYGICVTKTSGQVTINPIVNGAVDYTQTVNIDTNGQAGNPPAYSLLLSYTVGEVVTYQGQYYVCIVTTSPGILPTDPGDYFALTTAKRYVLRTLVSNPVTLPHSMQYNVLLGNGTIQNFAPEAIAPQVIQFCTYITEIDPNTGLISPGFPVLWTSNLNPAIEQLYATYVLVASDLLQCTVTGVTLSTPMQVTLNINTWGNEGNGGFENKLVGPNEIDATDGLAPFATIAQSGGMQAKSSILGTPTYNLGTPTLTFFKDTAALSATTPQEGDVIKCSYRSAGAAIGRCRDNSSVNIEQANWGDSGIRTSVHMGDLLPLPTTSQDCETVAAAIIAQNSITRYEGTYTVPSQNVTAEPVAGMILPFTDLTSDFPVSSFTEPVSQVITTFVGLNNGDKEFLSHAITFGLKNNSTRLMSVLAGFTLQTDVFTITDTTQTPVYVPTSGVGLSFAPDITNAIMDPTNGGTYGTWQADTVYSGNTILLDSNGNLQSLVSADFSSDGSDFSEWTYSFGASVVNTPSPSFLISGESYAYIDADVSLGVTITFGLYIPASGTAFDVRIGNNIAGDGVFLRIDTRSGFNSGFGTVIGWSSTSTPTTGTIDASAALTTGAWHIVSITINSAGTSISWYIDSFAQSSGTISGLNGMYLGFHSVLGAFNLANISVVGGCYTSGLEEPEWANVQNAIVELGSVITCQYVMVISNVLYIVSPVNIQGMLNINTVLALTGFEEALFLNGNSIIVASIPTTLPVGLPTDTPIGSFFTASISAPNYAYTSDVGLATVTASGGISLVTQDGTAVWELVGHSYGVDEDNYYFDMGQVPTGF